MGNIIQPLYKCAQQDLYAVSRLSLEFYSENLAAFARFKTKYNHELEVEMSKQIDLAEALPDVQNRKEKRSSLRIRLVQTTAQCIINWQFLKSYIVDGWDEEFRHKKLESAGSGYYSKAADSNWSAVRSLLNAGSTFMDENLEELLNKAHMPADFQKSFNLDRQKCFELSEQYFLSDSKQATSTSEKVAANNIVFKNLRSLCKDGQLVFTKDEDLKALFVFENLLTMIGKGRIAGMKCLVTDTATGAPLENVAVMSDNGKYHGITGKDGRLHLSRVATGTYIFTFTRPGYISLAQAITIKTGVTSNFDISLTAGIAEEEATGTGDTPSATGESTGTGEAEA